MGLGLVLGSVACGGSGGTPNNPPLKPLEWWTGLRHGTYWGIWGAQISSEGPPTNACDGPQTPTPQDTPTWWSSVNPNITGGSDAVGYTFWSDTRPGCSRALQRIFRSVMVADLSSLYAKDLPDSKVRDRIASATLEFYVIPQPATNPENWPCFPYMGAAGGVSMLRPGATVAAGLNRVGGTGAGPGGHDETIQGFPASGTPLVDLSPMVGPGTRGRATATDPGPGVHLVTVDVKDLVMGALFNNRQEIGFTVASIGERDITPPTDVQFDCRGWLQPLQLSVKYW